MFVPIFVLSHGTYNILLAKSNAMQQNKTKIQIKHNNPHCRCILGLLTYKTIFRSNFISISPSSYTARGSFARIGIPAPPNFNYATRSQRAKIESIGKWWGCHTCGSRMIFSNLKKNAPKFHGDHIPPVSVSLQSYLLHSSCVHNQSSLRLS